MGRGWLVRGCGDDVAGAEPGVGVALPVGDHSRRPPGRGGRRPPRPTGRGPARSSRRTPRPRSRRGRGSRHRPGAGPRTWCSARSNTGKYSGSRSRLARNGKPVAQIASSSDRVDTDSRSPSRNAPPPAVAQYVSPSIGACTTPTTGSCPTTRPTDTPTTGKRCRKFAVPSSGSTSQSTCGPLAALLLAEHREVGCAREQRRAHHPLARGVGRAHPVARALRTDVACGAERVAHDVATGTGRVQRELQQARQVETGGVRGAGHARAPRRRSRARAPRRARASRRR